LASGGGSTTGSGSSAAGESTIFIIIGVFCLFDFRRVFVIAEKLLKVASINLKCYSNDSKNDVKYEGIQQVDNLFYVLILLSEPPLLNGNLIKVETTI
jgi:hypothetical protein